MRFEETTGLSDILKKTELAMRFCIDVGLAPLKMTFSQYQVLSCLEVSKNLTNADLARKSQVTPQTMIRILQNLERDGFIRKGAPTENKLKIEMELTPRGLKAICDAHIVVNEIELKALKGLGKKERAAFQATLEHCLGNLLKGKG